MNNMLMRRRVVSKKLPYQNLTFEIISGGTIIWMKDNTNAADKTIEYKINNGEWISITASSTTGSSLTVSSGDFVEFRGNNTEYGASGVRIGGTAIFNVYGNLDSLIGRTPITTTDAFAALFSSNKGIRSAENLILPTNTTSGCYRSMFQASKITKAPATLPALELSTQCYWAMFYGCTSLTSVPHILPATVLKQDCYRAMFYECSNITAAPTLSALNLVTRCYYAMFQGCNKLSYIKAMFTSSPTSSPVLGTTYSWLKGVASAGTFVKNSDATWDVSGESGIPSGWTVIDATE